MLLPNLTPWVSQTLGFVYDWTIQGNDLRLTSAVANIGSGPLELRGGEIHGDLQDVYQRIYESDGSFTDVLAGVFRYHSEHGHIHFEEFAEFRLREVLPGGEVGAVVATGEKVSFCLLDVQRYGTLGPASPYYLSCDQLQGISVGWADVYHRGLPGQSIEITNVPDGDYWLEVEVDPGNRLLESDETNNVARIQIELTRPVGGNAIAPDNFEPNDSFAAAAILAPPEDHTYDNLSIHASLNDDYYRVTASATGTLAFDLAFRHSQGDIDMEVFNASQTLLGRSYTVSDREHFVVNAVAGEYYYVRVFGYEGATNPDYSMTIDAPMAPLPDPGSDPFTEGADTVALSSPNGTWHALGGNDNVTGTSSRDIIYGGADLDILIGEGGDDDLYGGTESDSLRGGAGNDWLDGGAGNDFALYLYAPSAVVVDLATNTASGGDGRDTLVNIEGVGGSELGDTLRGNGSTNNLLGYGGADRLEGGGGNDYLDGGSGGDTLVGGLGNDTIVGNAGADRIVGGSGKDILTGGTSRDIFDFNSGSETGIASSTRDVITDFRHLEDDIDLRDIDASSVLSGNNNFVWRGSGPLTTSAAGEIRFQKFDNVGTTNDYTIIYGDTDRDTGSEFQIILSGLVNLTSTDFIL